MNIKGILLVLLGAISYGIPASLFKLATAQSIAPANVLILQFWFAVLILGSLFLFSHHTSIQKIGAKQKVQLFFSGLAIATTNTLYFSALQYVSVAVVAVMIMQSVWVTMVYGFIFKRQRPSMAQGFSVLVIMVGTVLATEVLSQQQTLSAWGLFLGFCSACTFAGTIMITGNVASHAQPLERALWVSMGAGFFVTLFWAPSVDWASAILALPWGPAMALFAVVLPLLCFSKGMPLLTPSMGGLLSSVELPSAIVAAYLLLGESIHFGQLLGITLILLALLLPNFLKILKK